MIRAVASGEGDAYKRELHPKSDAIRQTPFSPKTVPPLCLSLSASFATREEVEGFGSQSDPGETDLALRSRKSAIAVAAAAAAAAAAFCPMGSAIGV
ncbi:hypothetical protein NL676_020583 [Syzygium grande]|nr:hypothetical protein NL676_020583 [Syzygium grande]